VQFSVIIAKLDRLTRSVADLAELLKRFEKVQSLSRSQEVRRLLERLSAEAASRGMVILRLETNRSLPEAKHLYERAGFVEAEPFKNEPYAHHWFQKDLRHK
jgi:GNAT superfamily N-acetyltransferase